MFTPERLEKEKKEKKDWMRFGRKHLITLMFYIYSAFLYLFSVNLTEGRTTKSFKGIEKECVKGLRMNV